jgi:hypothetical protein
MHCGACSNGLQLHGWAPEAECVANALLVADSMLNPVEVGYSDNEQQLPSR